MTSRRTGLFGASEDERESRLNQQRDYAAQLQEQVRIKNARAEQEKARRLQEQQQERELMDAQQQQVQGRRAQTQPTVGSLQPQQQQQHHQQQQTQPHSPPRSPQRSQQPQEPEVQHGSAMLNGSPQKQWGYNASPVADIFNYPTSSHAAPTSSLAFSAGVAPAPLVATFTPGASIFDSMLQPEASASDVNNQIDALRVLRLEMESSWKQRRLALQSIETKSCFILPPSPTASTRIPLSQDEKRLLDDDIELTPRPETPETPELTSIAGLLGDSILIPLTKAPSTQSTASPPLAAATSPSAAPQPRQSSAVHRRLAAAASAAATLDADDSCLDSNALKHDSELLHFNE